MIEAAPLAEQAARRFLTFRVEDRLYALPAEEVAEVIRIPAIARVPQAPKGLLGVANLRGEVLPVASLRGLLGRPDVEAQASRALVLDGAAPVALAVDTVDALVTVTTDRIETRPAELAAKPGEQLRGAFGVGDAVAKIVDVKALIAASFVAEERPRGRRAALAAVPQGPSRESLDIRRKLVSFEVAGQEFAVDLDSVQEIINAPHARAVLPESDGAVLGVTSFRDSLLPLLSLRGLLGFAESSEATGREKVVVTRVGTAPVGLVADRMCNLVSVDEERWEDVPPVLAARIGGEAKVEAIYRGEDGCRLVSVLAPRTLFREDVMKRLAASAAPAVAEKPQRARGEELQFVVFRLADDEFGLPIDAVSEVARVPEQITRLPKTPKFLEGVMNLRGEVLPVVDQRRRFDLPPRAGDASRRLLVVRTERHRAGLIVDSVSEVMRCTASDIEPAPSLVGEQVRLVQGVVNLDRMGRIVLLLDPAELLTRAERGLLDAFGTKPEKARS